MSQTWPSPYIPSLPLQGMPERILDQIINTYGMRFGWMKSHVCACTYGYEIPGSPDPNCNTCNGRGYYWDAWTTPFSGLLTYMHSSSAPDEPGAVMNPKYGQIERAEPTLTIPYSQQDVWLNASTMDAYVELDAITRFNSVLVTGSNTILPYQQQLTVENVYLYDPTAHTTSVLPSTSYVVSGAAVTLPGYPEGTAYTVEYTAAPVYLAWRPAGGMPHNRPFANGTGQIPKRFRLMALDLWTRGRNNGEGGTSPNIVGA